jgi:LPS sulfotransferase NodH
MTRLGPVGLAQRPPPPDWTPPRLLLAIAAVPRSGSTYFGELLRRTGQLGAPGEHFNKAMHKPDGGEDTVERRCRLVATAGRTPNGVATVKLFPPHFWWLQKEIRLGEWFPERRWVYIYRADKLGSAISAAIASLTGNWWGERDATAPPPVFSPRLVEEKLLDLLASELSWAAFFARNQIEPLTVVYEELEKRPADHVRAVADLAGVALSREPDIRTNTVRQRDALNEEWRRRFLAEAGSEDWLDPPALWRPYARTPRSFLRFLRGGLAVGPTPRGPHIE